MQIRLNPRGERLIERQLQSGQFRSPEDVIMTALEALDQGDSNRSGGQAPNNAVSDMLNFAEKHRFTLGEGIQLRDLIHQGHKH